MGNSAYDGTALGYGASSPSGVANGFASIKATAGHINYEYLSFKVGGNYKPLTYRTHDGLNHTVTSLEAIDMSQYINGHTFYNNFYTIGDPKVNGTIVNEFSNDNYITLPYTFSGLDCTTWEVTFRINIPNDITKDTCILGQQADSNSLSFLGLTTDNKMKMVLFNGDNELVNIIGNTSLLNNNWYYVRYSFTGSSYVMSYSTDNSSYTVVGSASNTTQFSGTPLYRIGYSKVTSNEADMVFYGAINLEGSEIKKDNGIWWNCLKEVNTGKYYVYVSENGTPYLTPVKLYRQAKMPSAFTAYKYATVDANNVARDFNPTGCIVPDVPLTTGSDPWELQIKLKFGNDISTPQSLLGDTTYDAYNIPVIQIREGKYYVWFSSNGSAWNIANMVAGTHIVSANSKEIVKIGWTGTNYYLDYKDENWKQGLNDTPSTANSYGGNIVFGNGIFIRGCEAGTSSNKFQYSYDGLNWVVGYLPEPYTWGKVYFLNEIFLMLPSSNQDRLYYSVDGRNWIKSTLPAQYGQILHDITYGNGKYVIYGEDKSLISVDGMAWEEKDLPTTTYTGTGSITYGEGLFVYTKGENHFFYSSDLKNWTEGEFPSQSVGASTIWQLVYGNGKFLAISDIGNLLYSENGIDWVQQTLPLTNGIQDIRFLNNRFIVMINDTNNVTLLSDNGKNWDSISIPNSGYKYISFGNNTYVSVTDGICKPLYMNLDAWYRDISISSTAPIFQYDKPFALGNHHPYVASQSPFLGEIYLNATFVTVKGKEYWKANPDEFIWENTSVYPTTIRKYNMGVWEEVDGVPIGEVYITREGVSSGSTYPYNNKYVTIPNSTRPSTVVNSYRNGSSWYIEYADKWIEMGGNTYVKSSGTSVPVVLFGKVMKDNLYTVTAQSQNGNPFVPSRTTTSMNIGSSTWGTVTWTVSGYLA